MECQKGVHFRRKMTNLFGDMLNVGYQLDIQVKPPKKKMEIELWFTGESKARMQIWSSSPEKWLLKPKSQCNSLERSCSQVTRIRLSGTKWSGEDTHSRSWPICLYYFQSSKLPHTHMHICTYTYTHHIHTYCTHHTRIIHIHIAYMHTTHTQSVASFYSNKYSVISWTYCFVSMQYGWLNRVADLGRTSQMLTQGTATIMSYFRASSFFIWTIATNCSLDSLLITHLPAAAAVAVICINHFSNLPGLCSKSFSDGENDAKWYDRKITGNFTFFFKLPCIFYNVYV